MLFSNEGGSLLVLCGMSITNLLPASLALASALVSVTVNKQGGCCAFPLSVFDLAKARSFT